MGGIISACWSSTGLMEKGMLCSDCSACAAVGKNGAGSPDTGGCGGDVAVLSMVPAAERSCFGGGPASTLRLSGATPSCLEAACAA